MATVTELVTKFVFTGSITPLALFNSQLGKSVGLLSGLSASFYGSAIAMAKWTSSILVSLNPLVQLSKQTGVAVETIQQLGYAAAVSGSSVSAMESTLSSLGKRIGSASIRGDADFSRLGIAIRSSNGELKTADQILFDIQGRFRELNLPMAQKRAFAESLGIDSSLLVLLDKTAAEMKTLRIEAQQFGLVSSKNTDQINDYNHAFGKLKFSFESVKRLIAIGLAPEVTRLANSFSRVVINNKEWIVEGVQKGAKFLKAFVDMMVRLKYVIGAVAAGFALAYAPIIAISAAIAATALAIDDLIVTMQGGDSLINRFGKFVGSLRNEKENRAMVERAQMAFAGGMSNNTTINQTNKIDVHTPDPIASATAIGDTLEANLEDAKLQANRGGR